MSRVPSVSRNVFTDFFPKAALDQQDDGLYLYRHMLPPNVADVAVLSECQTISIIATYGILAECESSPASWPSLRQARWKLR